MRYKGDHIRVMKVLGSSLPKRASVNTEGVVAQGFKGQDNAERRARNAYRMLRKSGHIEIADRGEYRLTASGGAFVTALAKNGFKLPEKAKPVKKAAKAKVAKAKVAKAKVAKAKVAKPKPAKKVAKAKPVKKAAKAKVAKAKPAKKVAKPKPAKKVAKPKAAPVKVAAAKKRSPKLPKAPKASNGASVTATPEAPVKTEERPASAQLTF